MRCEPLDVKHMRLKRACGIPVLVMLAVHIALPEAAAQDAALAGTLLEVAPE